MSQSDRIDYREATLMMELLSPLHIGSGEPDGGSDAGVVRDFNGLPGIPGTSLQGMLRDELGEVAARIFGYSGEGDENTGRGGRLWVSWGVIHDQHNNPVAKRINAACRDRDPVLRDAASPMLRDHVRLSECGVADTRKHGKFDELVVSAGHRFTMQLRLASAAGDDPNDWGFVEQVLHNPALRLGGKTRRGLGAFRFLNVLHTQSLTHSEIHRIKLTPETLWMFGGGTSDEADSAPVRGTRIVWDDTGKGTVQPVWILPGSAIKGALAHRTRFHANHIGGNFIGQEEKTDIESWLLELFGTEGSNPKEAKPGKVFINDLFIPLDEDHRASVQNHVALNPFTGGAKDSALFNDEPLKRNIKLPALSIQLRGSVTSNALAALREAVEDLRHGRLVLGAHAGRGYGVFRDPSLNQS